MSVPEPTPEEDPVPADIHLTDGKPYCTGDWTLEGSAGLDARLAGLDWPAGEMPLDGSRIDSFDTVGALALLDILTALERTGRRPRLVALRQEYQALFDLVRERNRTAHPPAGPAKGLGPVARLGKLTWDRVDRALSFVAFLGETSLVLLNTLSRPTRIRWRALVATIQSAGFNALPIVGLLSFLIGVVIAYQGGNQLKFYGANIYIVDLVAITMVRELAPMITAIIVAGRTGSAFAAQIGTMKITEEVDALRTLGIDPFDILVLPKLFGLLIALPLLAVFADAMSIFGGMVVASVLLDVSFRDFADRIPQAVTLFSFAFGIAKTPVFATIIALVGCYQGFRVRGGADSVGRQTTESVVQSIFLVIVADAVFAVFLGTKGLLRTS